MVPGCWSCRDVDGCLTRGWELIPSGCGGTSALARGTTPAARWLHEPQLIRNQSQGLGFPHFAGQYRPGGSAVISRVWSCGEMEGFLTPRWKLILSGCSRTSALARRATLAARWLHGPQSVSIQSVRLGFPHPVGRYRPGGSAVSSPGCWKFRDVEDFRGWDLILSGCGGTSALARGATLAARWLHKP